MNGRGPKLYALLARLPWPKSYLGKLMLIAFLGIHVPLIVLVLYLVFAASTDLHASLSEQKRQEQERLEQQQQRHQASRRSRDKHGAEMCV